MWTDRGKGAGIMFKPCPKNISRISGSYRDTYRWSQWFRQIHYTGQYFAQKAIYTEFLKAKNKGRFRKEHIAEIQAYEEARDWLKSFYPDGKMLPIKTLKEQKASLQEQIDQQKSSIRSLKDLTQDLRTVDKNVEAILHNQVPKKQKTQEPEL